MKLSVIIPMFNEEENVINTLKEIGDVLSGFENYEILVVDDGSQDETYKLANEFSKNNHHVRLLKHPTNLGMGSALKTGFNNAKYDMIVTIDADLSYTAEHILRLVEEFEKDETIDIVVGSPYMSGGKVEEVPVLRLLISKISNKLLGFSMKENLSTVTGILRAYKKEVIDSIELESSGTAINMEILSKANANRYKIKEIPAVLMGRKLGKSKLKFRATTISHLLFSFYEKPMILFGIIGLIIVLIGIISGIFLFYQYLLGILDPNRPLMLFMVLSILSGIQIIMFGFVATQISILRREIYLVQKESKFIRKKLEK